MTGSHLSGDLEEALGEFSRLGIAGQIDFQKLHLYSIITHSTAIEGSTVTEVENALLFDEGLVPGGRNVTEQMMNLDLKRAYDAVLVMAQHPPAITAALLCRLAALVMRNTGSVYHTPLGTFDSGAGDLRLLNVSAGRGGRSYLAYQKVPAHLAAFCDWLAKERARPLGPADGYALSFEAHYRLATIHPWADGNGRTSRLLMHLLQMERGLLPSVLAKEDKAGYIEVLRASQERQSGALFCRFMMEKMIAFLKESIRVFHETSGM